MEDITERDFIYLTPHRSHRDTSQTALFSRATVTVGKKQLFSVPFVFDSFQIYVCIYILYIHIQYVYIYTQTYKYIYIQMNHFHVFLPPVHDRSLRSFSCKPKCIHSSFQILSVYVQAVCPCRLYSHSRLYLQT